MIENKSKILYSRILDSLPYYAFLVDSEHKIIFANKSTREALKMDFNQIVGQYCPKVIHGSEKPIDECPLEKAVKTKHSTEKEFYDPKYKQWILSSVYPTGMKTEQGKDIYLHYAVNITGKKKAEEQIDFKEKDLQSRNSALKELLEHLITEGKTDKEKIINNFKMLMLPKLKLLEKKVDNSNKHLIDQIMNDFENICSSFGKKIINRELHLSPREIEICNLIRSGMKSTMIAKKLKLSFKTVETIRKNIRNKLKIQNKKINLQTFLKNI